MGVELYALPDLPQVPKPRDRELADAICDIIDAKIAAGMTKMRSDIAKRIRRAVFTGDNVSAVSLEQLADEIERQ